MGTLWFGGPIYTLQYEGHQVEAVFVEGDRIIEIGPLAEIERKYKEDITHIRNLNGDVMIPGLVDSHLHLIGHGEKLLKLDLSQMQSKTEVLAAVMEYSKGVPNGDWMIGEGWNEFLWESPEPIFREELDEIVPNHPLILKRVCRHVLVANSLALKLANINEDTICPPGGRIEKNREGRLNGLLKDQAQELLYSKIPKASDDFLMKSLKTAIQDAYRLGLTGVHTEDLNYYESFKGTLQIFKKVIEEEGLRFRAHLLVHHGVIRDFEAESGAYLKGNHWIEFGAIKIFSDGSLGGRTALLSHQYADDPSTNGMAIHTQEDLEAIVKEARRIKMPVAIHAIGDQAFDMALTAIERNPLEGCGRDRLIHAQILRKDLINRVKKLPLILDIQPGFVPSDFPWVLDRVGMENMEYNYAWKTLLEMGIPCAGGSDAPIEPLSPFLGIHAAVNRMKKDGRSNTVYVPKERLTVYEALCLYTKGNAYAACQEDIRGQIKEEYLADFTIINQDLFKINPSMISEIIVNGTVIGGELVYERKESY